MPLKRIWVLAPIAALALGATSARADDPGEAARQHAAEARQQAEAARAKAAEARAHAAAAASGNAEEAHKAQAAAKEARDEAKEARKDAREARKDAREARADGGLPEDQQRKQRRERRREHRAELRQKWGDALLRHPAVRAELRTHAWRLARLHRVRQLADAAGKKAVVERVDALIAKEQARHDKHMATLKSKGGEE